MATLSRNLIRRFIRMGSYLFLAAIVALTSFVGFGRKDKHTLDYSFSNNVAHADTPHSDAGGDGRADGGGDGDAAGGGGDDGDCFLAGTLIAMADGTEMPIEKITPGMKVLSFDTKTGGSVISTVEKVLVHDGVSEKQTPFDVHPLLEVVFESGAEHYAVQVTSNHPYLLSSGKYLAIGDIPVGAEVVGRSGHAKVQKKDVVRDSGVAVTYNLHLSEEPHNYFAAGIVVHNNKGAG